MDASAQSPKENPTRTSSWSKVVAQSSQYTPRDIAMGYVEEIFFDLMTNPTPQTFTPAFDETLATLRAAAEMKPLGPMSALTPAAQDKIILSFANYLQTAASRDNATHMVTGAQDIISESARIIMETSAKKSREQAARAEIHQCFQHPLNCE